MYTIRKECLVDPEIDASKKGFSMMRQTKRRQLAADIRTSEGMPAYRFHGKSLLSIGADKVMHLIASEETKEVMRRALLKQICFSAQPSSQPTGSQPSYQNSPQNNRIPHPNYTILMSEVGCIELYSGFRGRKAPKDVTEAPIGSRPIDCVLKGPRCGNWWMGLGGYGAFS